MNPVSPYFDAAQIEAIIAACQLRNKPAISDEAAEAVIRELGIAEARLQAHWQKSGYLAKGDVVNALEDIEKQCGSLLARLGATPEGETDSIPRQMWDKLTEEAEEYGREVNGYPNYGSLEVEIGGGAKIKQYAGAQQFMDAVKAIAYLGRWANSIAQKEKQYPRTRREIDARVVIRECCRIWSEVLGREIATSATASDGQGSGPLVRFCGACLDAFHVDGCSPTATRAIIERMSS